MAGLHRQVQLLADGRLFGHDLDQCRREVVRVRRCEADAADAIDARDRAQQIGESQSPCSYEFTVWPSSTTSGVPCSANAAHLGKDVARGRGSSRSRATYGTMQYVQR